VQIRLWFAIPVLTDVPDMMPTSPEELHLWMCRFGIVSGDQEEVHRAHGLDSLMAVISALSSARNILDEQFPDAAWEGFEHHGLNVMVSHLFVSASLQRAFEDAMWEARQRTWERLREMGE